jgi:glucans biosynthesis protein
MPGSHQRNTVPMLASPRCGAKTRNGSLCKAPAVASKRRCRMHGGADGSGAPKGNRNAFTTGLHTREAIEMRRLVNQVVRMSRKMLSEPN